MRLALGLALIIAASGCAYNRQYFRPTERVRGQTVQGYQEAFYNLVGPRGAFGEAKVWSPGAYRHKDDSVIEVTLELHNTSGQQLAVAAQDLRLDPVRGQKGVLRNLTPAESGVFRVQSQARASVQVHFILPAGWKPGHVQSFGFAWRVTNADQAYAQATPFREEAAYYPTPPPGYPYYSPVYPCSPYDVHCVGFYDGWPYPGTVYGPPLIIEQQREERRRVEVK